MTAEASPPGPLARRMGEIEPFHVMDLLARARAMEAAGHDVVHMEIGEPDFATPAPVLEAAMQALRDGHTHYTPALGLQSLRQAIADDYRNRFQAEVDPRRIVITPGASGALLLAFGLLVDRDQQVLMADPGYPCNRHFARFVEGHARSIAVDAASRYQLDAAMLARHWQADTVAALVASPANPTGTIIAADELAAMAKVCQERGGVLVVDEIYQGLVYDQPRYSALAHSDKVFVVNSFSKYFCMTGWRLGWLVVPEQYIDAVDRLAQNIFLAASTPAQYAALASFSAENLTILEQRREEFRRRRDYLLPALRELGFRIDLQPEGAFYLYADVSDLTDDSYRFAMDILERQRVAITPGIDFGSHRARSHVRFAYTTSMERLQLGVERLREFMQR